MNRKIKYELFVRNNKSFFKWMNACSPLKINKLDMNFDCSKLLPISELNNLSLAVMNEISTNYMNTEDTLSYMVTMRVDSCDSIKDFNKALRSANFYLCENPLTEDPASYEMPVVLKRFIKEYYQGWLRIHRTICDKFIEMGEESVDIWKASEIYQIDTKDLVATYNVYKDFLGNEPNEEGLISRSR